MKHGTKVQTYLREVLSKFVIDSIWRLLKLLLALIFTVSLSVFSSGVLSSAIVFLYPFRWIIMTMFISGGLLLFFILYSKYNRFRPDFNSLSEQVSFRILEKEIFYQYLDYKRMVYKKKVVLEALKNGIDTFKDKYRWSGTGKVVMKSAVPEHSYVLFEPSNIFQCYEVKFQKTLAKGETIKTEMVWDLEDTGGTSLPFMSASIQEPTERLTFELQLPVHFGVKTVVCDTCSCMGGKPIESVELPIESNGTVKWIIDKPRLLHYYELRWIMPKNK